MPKNGGSPEGGREIEVAKPIVEDSSGRQDVQEVGSGTRTMKKRSPERAEHRSFGYASINGNILLFHD